MVSGKAGSWLLITSFNLFLKIVCCRTGWQVKEVGKLVTYHWVFIFENWFSVH